MNLEELKTKIVFDIDLLGAYLGQAQTLDEQFVILEGRERSIRDLEKRIQERERQVVKREKDCDEREAYLERLHEKVVERDKESRLLERKLKSDR